MKIKYVTKVPLKSIKFIKKCMKNIINRVEQTKKKANFNLKYSNMKVNKKNKTNEYNRNKINENNT